MKYLVCIVLSFILFWVTPIAWAGDKEDVAAVMQKWGDAFLAYTPDQILALYHKEAVLWGTTSPTRRDDPAAIREYFEKSFKFAPIKVTFKDPLIRIYGDVAINTGYYTFSNPFFNLPARYSFVYIKQGGRWLIVDHHSSKVPVPP